MDTDNDGKVSREEFAKGHQAMFDRLDVNKDGTVGRDEIPGPGAGPGRGMGMLRMMDSDGDGKVTREELAKGQREMFDRFDADKDGFISRDEMPGPGGRVGPGAAPDSKPQVDSKVPKKVSPKDEP